MTSSGVGTHSCYFARNCAFWGYDYVAPCCVSPKKGTHPPRYFDSVRNLDEAGRLEELILKRHSLLNPSLVHGSCADCRYKRSRNDEKLGKFRHMILSHIEFCELSCIYCYQSDPSYPKNLRREPYSIATTFELMLKNDMLSADVDFFWGGGEPMSAAEFWNAAKWINDQGYAQIVNTHGVRFHGRLLDVLRKVDRYSIVCSIDAGNPETYKRVKGVNGYDVVWNNLIKYKSLGVKVVPKYIFLNSNFGESLSFIDRASKLGFEVVCFDFDLNEVFEAQGSLPYQEEFEAALSYANAIGLLVNFASHSWCAMNNLQSSTLLKCLSTVDYDYSVRMGPFDTELRRRLAEDPVDCGIQPSCI